MVLGVLRGLCGVASPVVLLVGMLQTAGPPMINLGVMTGLSGTAEKETARLLLLTYSLLGRHVDRVHSPLPGAPVAPRGSGGTARAPASVV
eukprot:UN5147